MNVKEKLIADINNIEDLHLLNQLLELLKSLNISTSKSISNVEKVLAFAGTLTNEEAYNLQNMINEEFNKIEGDWN